MSCKCNISNKCNEDIEADRKRRYNWWYYKDMLRECPDYLDRIANATEYSKKDRRELDG